MNVLAVEDDRHEQQQTDPEAREETCLTRAAASALGESFR
jgi:hypothetical protein